LPGSERESGTVVITSGIRVNIILMLITEELGRPKGDESHKKHNSDRGVN
jgi:hypothetical protein